MIIVHQFSVSINESDELVWNVIEVTWKIGWKLGIILWKVGNILGNNTEWKGNLPELAMMTIKVLNNYWQVRMWITSVIYFSSVPDGKNEHSIRATHAQLKHEYSIRENTYTYLHAHHIKYSETIT